MDVNLGRVFIVRHVKFDESTLHHQLLKTTPPKIALEPAEQGNDSEIEEPPKVVIQSPKAKVQPPKTYRAALDAEDAEQWKEAIGKEVGSMESHEVFTFVEKVPEGDSMFGSRWVMGRKLMANGTIGK
jgi:hypothetical protein